MHVFSTVIPSKAGMARISFRILLHIGFIRRFNITKYSVRAANRPPMHAKLNRDDFISVTLTSIMILIGDFGDGERFGFGIIPNLNHFTSPVNIPSNMSAVKKEHANRRQ